MCQTLCKYPGVCHRAETGGALFVILESVWKKNRNVCTVKTAISLETVAKVMEIGRSTAVPAGYELELETIQIQVSRAKEAGKSHLMQAENPMYIFRLKLKVQGRED